MTQDYNSLRAHYRGTSSKLARQKARARLVRWLIAYSLALVIALLALLA